MHGTFILKHQKNALKMGFKRVPKWGPKWHPNGGPKSEVWGSKNGGRRPLLALLKRRLFYPFPTKATTGIEMGYFQGTNTHGMELPHILTVNLMGCLKGVQKGVQNRAQKNTTFWRPMAP